MTALNRLMTYQPNLQCTDDDVICRAQGSGEYRIAYSIPFLMARCGYSRTHAAERAEAMSAYVDRDERDAARQAHIDHANRYLGDCL